MVFGLHNLHTSVLLLVPRLLNNIYKRNTPVELGVIVMFTERHESETFGNVSGIIIQTYTRI